MILKPMDVFKGSVYYYRVYDVGFEIDLQEAQRIFEAKNLISIFRLNRQSQSIIVDGAPLVVSLGEQQYNLLGRSITTSVVAKIWNFGAISVNIKIPIEQEISHNDFKNFAHFIDCDAVLENQAKKLVYDLVTELGRSIKQSHIWNQYEDYIIYLLDPTVVRVDDYSQLLDSEALYDLILTETNLTLSNQVKQNIKNSYIQYSTKDICIVDWNSALVCSSDDYGDICDVLEFGLTQLLEMRYYDHYLDKQLAILYKEIQNKQSGLLSGHFKKLSKESAFLYIEISDVIERVENAMKFIGDVYYARILRLELEKFRLGEWSSSVDIKLKNLADISDMFRSDLNDRRGHLLEIIIILLIAVELIPLAYKAAEMYWP